MRIKTTAAVLAIGILLSGCTAGASETTGTPKETISKADFIAVAEQAYDYIEMAMQAEMDDDKVADRLKLLKVAGTDVAGDASGDQDDLLQEAIDKMILYVVEIADSEEEDANLHWKRIMDVKAGKWIED